ncbi:hypothetical protein Tco_1544907 [Tanacetum coccineum]
MYALRRWAIFLKGAQGLTFLLSVEKLHCSGDVPGSLPISGRMNDDRNRMAEQPLNAKMVVEDIKIELRVETCDGSVKGFVKWEGLNKMIKELMEGEKGKKVRKKLKEVGAAAKKALAEDGSS